MKKILEYLFPLAIANIKADAIEEYEKEINGLLDELDGKIDKLAKQ